MDRKVVKEVALSSAAALAALVAMDTIARAAGVGGAAIERVSEVVLLTIVLAPIALAISRASSRRR
ncbi:MAG: hypothetical protein GXO32_02465 [Crenarchaeota archaeon]|nr:hypothetical protein [Thermoproteota archaeon]